MSQLLIFVALAIFVAILTKKHSVHSQSPHKRVQSQVMDFYYKVTK